MSTPDANVMATALALLREGKIQEADAAIAAGMAAAAAAASTAAAATPDPPPPRPPQTVLQELLSAIVDRLGNHPVLVGLLDELAAVLPNR